MVASTPTKDLRPMQSLGRLDSSAPDTLIDFLRWGLSVCPAERIAVVLRSPMVLTPADAERYPDRLSVFSLAHDEASNGHLDVSDMAAAVRHALAEAGRARLDLLAIDSCQVQFLELAYELEHVVHVVIAPQSVVPMAGWHYGKVLAKWKAKAVGATPISTREMAKALLDDIAGSYARGPAECSVSALDLRRLDGVARAFDNLCIGTLQLLGEGLIWRTRELMVERLRESSGPVYDCGSFFALWKEALEAMADDAHLDWLGTTLTRTLGTSLDPFCEAAARYLDEVVRDTRVGSLVEAATARRASAGVISAASEITALDRFRQATATRLDHAIDLMRAENNEQASRDAVRTRLKGFVKALRLTARARAGARMVHAVEVDVDSRVKNLGRDGPERSASRRARSVMCDALLQFAVLQAFPLLPVERQFDLERMVDSTDGARRIAQQSEEASLALLGDPNGELSGMVIAQRSHPARALQWPRWTGVSIYRPTRLDDLMNASYARFAFHRRVHWAALLGAANLIGDHPRALWRLVSSLLATGTAATRRDVLRRLTGPDSVVWGLRDQFQVMTPAPTLTVSLERRGSATRADSDAPPQMRENYLLRLESVNRGAVVTEQESRVQPRVMDRALDELNALLRERAVTRGSLKKLRSIGGLLGEDIFQSLGRTLEEERLEIIADQPGITPHLQLQIPAELMKYPWELLHQNGEWLGERYALGRQVFMQTGLARRVPARRQGRIRPLVIGDPVLEGHMKEKWQQLRGARDEAEQVAAFFEAASSKVGNLIEFDRKQDVKIHETLTCADMRALLRDGGYDIVHFAGHGIFESRDPETSAWILSDGELWSLEIRNTLAGHWAPPWLVYANACEAAMDAAVSRSAYQGNVFGLATAFINQGVAAYIGPLWPIDDLMAQHIALNFYRHLLGERLTLGESLRRSKMSARQIAYPDSTNLTDEDKNFASLGWASLVLYGDPTEELYQGLAGRSTGSPRVYQPMQPASGTRFATAASGRSGARGEGARAVPATTMLAPMIHVADRVAKEWVSGPGMKPLDDEQRGTTGPNRPSKLVLELIEDAGLRRWRVASDKHARGSGGDRDGLPGSPFAALLADDRVRWLMPANRGLVRTIGRWAVTGSDNGTQGLVHAYDVDQVRHEGLLTLNGDKSTELRPLTGGGSRSAGADDRALLLIHGTLSKTAVPVDGFGPEFFKWARGKYSQVLGFDHWTLSKSPEENAQMLLECLRASSPHLLKGRRLDILAHSRGGLVARALCDLLDQRGAVGNLVFLGTPNCGTDLGNPKRWGTLADVLVNMSGVTHAELFGRLAGLLARLAADKVVDGVPGLLAQNPEEVTRKGSFLCRLQHAAARSTKVKYGIICAEFEPTALVPNLRMLVKSAADAGLDLAADAFFGGANDLVVNTSHGWSIGATPDQVLKGFPKWIDPRRVLLFTPPHTDLRVPGDITIEAALGVHHINLLSQPKVQTTIQSWLS
jgi:CHAT domain-containing protein